MEVYIGTFTKERYITEEHLVTVMRFNTGDKARVESLFERHVHDGKQYKVTIEEIVDSFDTQTDTITVPITTEVALV